MEILVVDGMSEDGTTELLLALMDERKSLSPSPPERMVLLENPQRIVPVALNIGLRPEGSFGWILPFGACTTADPISEACGAST
jgi:hypothetical protein